MTKINRTDWQKLEKILSIKINGQEKIIHNFHFDIQAKTNEQYYLSALKDIKKIMENLGKK